MSFKSKHMPRTAGVPVTEFKLVSEIDLENATLGSDEGVGPTSEDIRGEGDCSSDLLRGIRGAIGGLFLTLTTP